MSDLCRLLSITDDLGLADRRAVGRDDPHAPALEQDSEGEVWVLVWSQFLTGGMGSKAEKCWHRYPGIHLGWMEEEQARSVAAALQLAYLAGVDSAEADHEP